MHNVDDDKDERGIQLPKQGETLALYVTAAQLVEIKRLGPIRHDSREAMTQWATCMAEVWMANGYGMKEAMLIAQRMNCEGMMFDITYRVIQDSAMAPTGEGPDGEPIKQ